MRSHVFIILFILFGASAQAQNLKTKNFILVTLDGFRWQELFQGADSAILFNDKYVSDKRVIDNFWNTQAQQRREKLLPFFWNTISKQGQLYGNREYGNYVNCSNPHWFSYPGYGELFNGFVDRRIRSNNKIVNPNLTVLDFIERQDGFNGKVAAFGTWDTFPYILGEQRGTIPVNAGTEKAVGCISEGEMLLNELQDLLPNPHGERYDAFTYSYALEYLKRERPRMMFIGFDETDQHGHGGRYDQYLLSANRTDKMLGQLWSWIQSQDDYKDQTTLIVTTDHGRGKGDRKSWKNHGRLAFGSGQLWVAVIGPDTPPAGEVTSAGKLFQKQLAATVAAMLGFSYTNEKEVGEVIHSMFQEEAMAKASE